MEPTSSPPNDPASVGHLPSAAAHSSMQPPQYAIHESEVHRRLILEAARDYAIFTTDLQRRITSWNAGAEAMFGYPEAGMLGQSADKLYVPEDRAQQAPEQEATRALAEGRAENERWHLRHDGSRLYGSGVITPLKNDQNTPIGLVKVIRDLTSQKLAEEALQRAEQRQAFLLRLSDALRALTNPIDIQATAAELLGQQLNVDQTQYIEVQEATGELVIARGWQRSGLSTQPLRYPATDWPVPGLGNGKTWVVYDTDTDPAMPADQRAVYHSHAIGAAVVVPLHRQGRLVAALVTNQRAPRRWTPNEVSLVEETAERTWAAVERTKAEAALQESEKRHRLAIDAAELGTWDWNLRTDEVVWNEQHFRLFGLVPRPNPLDPGLFFSHVHPDDRDRISAELEKAIATKGIFDTEFCALLDDGSQRWMSGYGRVVEEINGQPVRMSGVMFDIDERRRAEDALRLVHQRKDEFLALLAHELRNPLATLNYTLQILQLTGGTHEAMPLSTATTLMSREVAHLVRLVDDLLDVSRISRGKIVLVNERIDLVAVVRETIEALMGSFREAGRTVQAELPAHPLYLLGDATRLKQVVSNLLNNALKFTRPGGHVWITLHATPQSPAGPTADLRVRDDGIGIAEHDRDRIFQMFVQVDLSLGRTQDGLGLGLTLVNELVGLHGGRVTVHSDGDGLGSEFIVYLPLEPDNNEAYGS